MAHRIWKVRAAALWDELTWELSLVMQKLMQDKWENLDQWKVHFLGESEGFEEEERQMPLEWMNGMIDNQGGREKNNSIA